MGNFIEGVNARLTLVLFKNTEKMVRKSQYLMAVQQKE